MRDVIEQLLNDQPLSESQAEDAFERIFRGDADDPQIAAMLALIQRRQATVDELVGAARVMRRHAQHVSTKGLPAGARVLDTCGTGGTPKTFNISTVAAIIVAAAGRDSGVFVAKHGNRSRSGRGSAEVLQTLGVNIDASPDVQARCLEQTNVCFCFAIRHHPAAKHAAKVRLSLGVPTIFNLLGPLTNPAGATRQLLGVFDPSRVEPMAQALSRLGAERAWIVHSDDGLDEIATSAPTRIAEVNDGDVSIRTFDPVEVGVERITLDQIRARDLEAAAALVRAIFDGVDEADVHAARDIAVVNAAAALVVTDGAASMKDGMEFARQAIASGAAARTLEALARVSHESA